MQSIKILSLVWLFFIPQSKANSAFNLDSQNYSVKLACVRTNYDEGASSSEELDTTRLACCLSSLTSRHSWQIAL